tara:strand:+ start:389 stop:610 length:222 start_codon:yes stop_codon:yes gene_type:complete
VGGSSPAFYENLQNAPAFELSPEKYASCEQATREAADPSKRNEYQPPPLKLVDARIAVVDLEKDHCSKACNKN